MAVCVGLSYLVSFLQVRSFKFQTVHVNHGHCVFPLYMTSDLSFDGPSHVCVCGRSFMQAGPLTFHQRTCRRTKRQFSGALDKAREAWMNRKKRRVESAAELEQSTSQIKDTDQWDDTTSNTMDIEVSWSFAGSWPGSNDLSSQPTNLHELSYPSAEVSHLGV